MATGKENVFMFTNWYADPSFVMSWFHWLSHRGVPVAMIRWDRKGGDLYAVWRGCRGAAAERDKWKCEAYSIVREENGFGILVGARPPAAAGTGT